MQNPLKVALAVLSGRKNVCELSSDERLALGITFDPKTSIELRDYALELTEEIVFRPLNEIIQSGKMVHDYFAATRKPK